MKFIDQLSTGILLLSPSLLLLVGFYFVYSTYGNDRWLIQNRYALYRTHSLGAYELIQDRDLIESYSPAHNFLSGVCAEFTPEENTWFPSWKGLCVYEMTVCR